MELLNIVRPIRLILMLCCLGLAACNRSQNTPIVPTRITSVSAMATEITLTENAPPEGYREFVAFPQIDANLPDLSNWRYEMTLEFDGVFSGTPRPAQGRIRAQVWYNQFGTQRRVIIETSGALFGSDDDRIALREAVRLGPDAYLVENNTCAAAGSGEPAIAADLQVSQLIGGVNRAVPMGVKAVINGEEVWRYDFAPDALLQPYLRLGGTARIVSQNSELWVAPSRNAVIRFWVTMNIENAVLFENLIENALPISGEIILRYDVYQIGIDPNITQPFGC